MSSSSSSTESALFTPLQVGRVTVSHRIVLAPLSRSRATKDHVPTNLAVEYYKQRSAVPGSLLITEGTPIHPAAGTWNHAPYIYTDDQVKAWKKVADAVHANGSYIFMQLWALGRASRLDLLKAEDPNLDLVSASDIPLSPAHSTPRPLTIPEIKTYIQWYAQAADKAVNQAHFDGVELHFAGGYLPDQFLQDVSNHRSDEYGGSIENRARFPLEIIDAVSSVIGQDRVAFRISPLSEFQGMKLKTRELKPTFSYFVSKVKERFPNIAYLHVIEARVRGEDDYVPYGEMDSNDFLREIWGDKPFIVAGGYTPQNAVETADTKGGLIAFGRHYIANPDLPLRIKYGIPLTKYDRSTFYTPAEPHGYIDYPTATLSQLTDAPVDIMPPGLTVSTRVATMA